MTTIGKRRVRVFFLLIPAIVASLSVCAGFAQITPPQPAEGESRELKTPEPIEKTEEAREEERTRKFQQTQYELDEMGMSPEERKMKRVRPDRP